MVLYFWKSKKSKEEIGNACKGTVMKIKKALKNHRFTNSKIILKISHSNYNFTVIYQSKFLVSSLLFSYVFSVYKQKACNTPPWVFFTFFKLNRWYQIEQNITYTCYYCSHILLPTSFSLSTLLLYKRSDFFFETYFWTLLRKIFMIVRKSLLLDYYIMRDNFTNTA